MDKMDKMDKIELAGQLIQTRLLQANSNGKTKFIDFELIDETLTRTWGLIGGKTQTTSHRYKGVNIGKSNELNPIETAREDYERIIKKKKKEGYSSDLKLIKEMNWNEIDTSFCCSKPIAKPNEMKINYALKNNQCIVQKKYNGLCHYILITDTGGVKIYTRRMDDHTEKYPALVRSFMEKNLPHKSILISEFTTDMYSEDHLETFKTMSSISKVDTLKGKLKEDQTESLRRQNETPVYAVVFGVLCWDGDEVWKTWRYRDQEYLLREMFFQPGFFIKIPESFKFHSLKEMQEFLKTQKQEMEGLVVWMLDEKLKVTMNGKPNRKAAYKVKVTLEDDYIAYGYNEGKGKKQGKIGALKIGKMKDNQIVPVGVVGSGLKDSDLDPSTWNFPCVVVIEYANMFSTGKLQHPVFICKHGDKVPEEVTL